MFIAHRGTRKNECRELAKHCTSEVDTTRRSLCDLIFHQKLFFILQLRFLLQNFKVNWPCLAFCWEHRVWGWKWIFSPILTFERDEEISALVEGWTVTTLRDDRWTFSINFVNCDLEECQSIVSYWKTTLPCLVLLISFHITCVIH